ncbi:MAG: hypothetical protein LBG11_01315, partial [Bifidobacteriaceae bacterium]|nr:hypothetical protein [Bifidobacteriaceae bacterium]
MAEHQLNAAGKAKIGAETDAPEGTASGPEPRTGAGLVRGGRVVWVLAGVAVVALVAGFVLGGLVRSPADVAAEAAPPPEGLITAAVEARAITSTVVARADVAYDDPVAIQPATPEGAESAVVTGMVPEVGQEVVAGGIVLEVSGRPVFALPGEFKAYRTLGPGSNGPDVAQLRTALEGLGFGAGQSGAKEYDRALADAVRALYVGAGYQPPGAADLERAQAVQAARDALDDAKSAVPQAKGALNAAREALKQAPPESQTEAQAVVDAAAIGVDQAERAVTRAKEALEAAERQAWTPMPVGEAVFVADLPRRVDQVNVKVGDDLAAPVDSCGAPSGDVSGESGGGLVAPVVLSGAEIKVTAQVAVDEAALLTVGGPAVLNANGAEIIGEIASICDGAESLGDGHGGQGGAGGGDACLVGVTVTDLAGIDPATLVGNLQVTMVVGTTSEDSLVVPVAAVAADTAGRARIEVVDGSLDKTKPAGEQKTITVLIEPGLSAEGMVEIKTAEPAIEAGDLVVVGAAGSGSG